MNFYNYKEVPDEVLVENIQKGFDVNNSYAEISERHSGAFLKMAHKWVSRHIPSKFELDADHIFSSKDYVIYKSVMSFDPSRRTKLSTHITNNSMWFCSNAVKAGDKHSVTFSVEEKWFDMGKLSYEEFDWEKSKIREIFNEIVDKVSKKFGKKGELIFKLRYGGNRVLKWSEVMKTLLEEYNIKVGEQTCLSYQKKIITMLRQEFSNNPKIIEYTNEKINF